jgi:uncharacterized membrane protein YccC
MFITVLPVRIVDLWYPNPEVMKPNMGTTDRILRTIVAVVIALLYFTGMIPGTLGIVLLVLAVVFLATSMMSFCPLYAPFGISTCKTK